MRLNVLGISLFIPYSYTGKRNNYSSYYEKKLGGVIMKKIIERIIELYIISVREIRPEDIYCCEKIPTMILTQAYSNN